MGLGHYAARPETFEEPGHPGSATGTYRATLTTRINEAIQPPLQRFASYAFPEELARFTPDRNLAASIAEEGGGKVNPTLDDILHADRQVPERIPLGYYPALAALAFFLIAVWVRRL